jgi:hypothetical protein
MREFILATWGRWDEARVRQESLEDSISPNAQVIQIGDVGVGVLLVERLPTHIQKVSKRCHPPNQLPFINFPPMT